MITVGTRMRDPAIDLRWGHVIPIAAVLVEGHNDDGFRPILTQLDFAQQLTEVGVAREHVGIARVLVFRAEGVVEDDVRGGSNGCKVFTA